jgi:hypothetical protein
MPAPAEILESTNFRVVPSARLARILAAAELLARRISRNARLVE